MRYTVFLLSVKYSFLSAEKERCRNSENREHHQRDPQPEVAVIAGLRRGSVLAVCRQNGERGVDLAVIEETGISCCWFLRSRKLNLLIVVQIMNKSK